MNTLWRNFPLRTGNIPLDVLLLAIPMAIGLWFAHASPLAIFIAASAAIIPLAGALGAKAWVALKHVPDWRWLMERNDSPWYPAMRLFRQAAPGDWDSVFREMEAALKTLL